MEVYHCYLEQLIELLNGITLSNYQKRRIFLNILQKNGLSKKKEEDQ